MKQLSKFLEGLLDTNFDISAEWVIWSKYLDGVSSFKGYSYDNDEEYLTEIEPKLLDYISSRKKLGKAAALNESKYPCVVQVTSRDGAGKGISIYCRDTMITVRFGHLSARNDEKRAFPKHRGWDVVGFWEFPEELFNLINDRCKEILSYYK